MFLAIIQIVLGVLLSFYYEASSQRFYVVMQIHLESCVGHVLRLSHLFLARFLFLVIYLHIIKGLYQNSFYKFKMLWCSGYSLFLVIIIIAFLGYVLPWGQIRLWGATVITNLLRVLPYGDALVFWIWRGFFISNYTLKLFFSIHFLAPLLIIALATLHIIILHYLGSSNPLGVDFPLNKREFLPNFLVKDLLNIGAILFIFGVCWLNPYYFRESENFLLASYLSSPLHIKPEWYFLQFYSILRAIPNKLGGVLAFFVAVIRLAMIVLKVSTINYSSFKGWGSFVTGFLVINLLLMWLGGALIEHPFDLLSKIFTFIYFFWFLVLFTFR